jgi:4-hydroxybutyrate dehydrogenase
MTPVTFAFPAPILFGPGALAGLPARLNRLAIAKPLVVTDSGLLQTSAFKALDRTLAIERKANEWALFSEVHPNPIEDDVRGAAAAFQKSGCDGVIGFGGGSALDVAKAVRLLVNRPNLDFNRFYDESDWSRLAPFVAIPTTAGTGSEVGRSSVLTLKSTRRKAVLFHPELLAKLVVLDPELTADLPPKLTAATGADALTHCIESFTCPVFHPMCDGIALEGIRLIVEALPRAFKKGHDLDARGRMLMAAAMGAVAFQKDLGVVHSLAHPLSTVCGLHHGLANALCLPAGMRFCAARSPGIYRRIGMAFGLDLFKAESVEADHAAIEFITRFLAELGLSSKLREHGVREEHLPELVEQAVADPCHKSNVVPVSRDDFMTLYRECL